MASWRNIHEDHQPPHYSDDNHLHSDDNHHYSDDNHHYSDDDHHYSDDNNHNEGQDLCNGGRVKLYLKASSAASFDTLKMAIILKMPIFLKMLIMTVLIFIRISSPLSFDDDDGGTSRSWKESTVELFLEEVAELEPAKVAPELKMLNVMIMIIVMIMMLKMMMKMII